MLARLRCSTQHLRAFAALTTVAVLGQISASGQGAAVGDFDGQMDVGAAQSRERRRTTRRQQYTMTRDGPNMWAAHDDFHFVWKRMSGNFILSTRARSSGKASSRIAKSAWTHPPRASRRPRHMSTARVARRRHDVDADATHQRRDDGTNQVGRQPGCRRRAARAT